MGRLFGKLLKWIMPVGAAVIITLALLVGVARLMLPQISSYRAEIRSWVQGATGFELNFRHISAGLSFSGPELRLSEVTLNWPQDNVTVLRADQIDVGLSLWVFITQGLLMPGRVAISGSRVELERGLDGKFYLQGRPWNRLDELRKIDVLVKDVEFSYQDLLGEAALVGKFHGNIESATFRFKLPVGQPPEFDVRATFADLGYTGTEPAVFLLIERRPNCSSILSTSSLACLKCFVIRLNLNASVGYWYGGPASTATRFWVMAWSLLRRLLLPKQLSS